MEHPVRDQHGHPLPEDGAAQMLSDHQIEEALVALPGWRHSGSALLRTVPVVRDSRDALAEGVRTVVPDQRQVRFDDGADGVTIALLGGPYLTADDIETAARIDTVLSGSGTDRGRS
jgi:pterin-4a-carbinolamine dehydratase